MVFEDESKRVKKADKAPFATPLDSRDKQGEPFATQGEETPFEAQGKQGTLRSTER
jgi:hypothetical protein